MNRYSRRCALPLAAGVAARHERAVKLDVIRLQVSSAGKRATAVRTRNDSERACLFHMCFAILQRAEPCACDSAIHTRVHAAMLFARTQRMFGQIRSWTSPRTAVCFLKAIHLQFIEKSYTQKKMINNNKRRIDFLREPSSVASPSREEFNEIG